MIDATMKTQSTSAAVSLRSSSVMIPNLTVQLHGGKQQNVIQQ
jgi:hypothetical protein